MKEIIIATIIMWIVEDKILFTLQSKKEAKKVNYNCEKCEMWPCIHEITPKQKINIYPMKDYSKYCGKKRKEEKNV